MDGCSSNLDSHIVPGHPRLSSWIQAAHHKIAGKVYIGDSKVAEICATPKILVIGETMVGVVPPSIANVQPSNKGYLLINEHHLLVVAPEERNNYVIGMPYHFDVLVQAL